MIAKVDMDRALLDFAISGEPKQKSKRNHKRRVEPDLRSGRPKTIQNSVGAVKRDDCLSV